MSINAATPAQALPPLLRAPLEIRREIYGHFLNADILMYGNSPTQDPPRFDLRPLSICRQMRMEAWNYLKEFNKWVCVADYGRPDAPSEPLRAINVPLALPETISREMKDEIRGSQLVLAICLGHGCTSPQEPKRQPLTEKIFPATPEMWMTACEDLAGTVQDWKYILIVIPERLRTKWSDLFPNFLIYLAGIRTAERAHFLPIMDVPVFERMAANMEESWDGADEWHDMLRGLLEHSTVLEEKGMIMGASAIRGIGIFTSLRLPDLMASRNPIVITPTTNTMYAIYTDIRLAQAKALNHFTEQKMLHSDSEAINTSIQAYDKLVELLWSWPGMSLEQRRQAHIHHGQVLMHQVTYLRYKATPIDAILACINRPDITSFSNDDDLLRRAASHYFSAIELDKSQAEPLRQILANIKKQVPKWTKPRIIKLKVAGSGTWACGEYF